MGSIVTLPTGEIIDFVDELLKRTEQFNNHSLDFESINSLLKLTTTEVDIAKEIKLPEVGEQLEIRGILNISEKQIIINSTESEQRKRFSNAHELGHYTLPKHREILYQCTKEDMSHLTYLIIEKEANQFAANLLFKGSSFDNYINNFDNLTFRLIKDISVQYSSSITAALRRTIEQYKKPAAMVVIREVNSKPRIQYTITSPIFRKKYFKDVANMSKLQEIFNESLTSTIDAPVKKDFNLKLHSGNNIVIKGVFFYNTYELLGILVPDK